MPFHGNDFFRRLWSLFQQVHVPWHKATFKKKSFQGWFEEHKKKLQVLAMAFKFPRQTRLNSGSPSSQLTWSAANHSTHVWEWTWLYCVCPVFAVHTVWLWRKVRLVEMKPTDEMPNTNFLSARRLALDMHTARRTGKGMKENKGRSSCHLNSVLPRICKHFAYCCVMFCPGAAQASVRTSFNKLYSAIPVTFALVNLERVKGPSPR